MVESVTPEDMPAVIETTAELGGYFRRWRGGELQRWTQWNPSGHKANAQDGMTIDERLTLAFLKVKTQRGRANNRLTTKCILRLQTLITVARRRAWCSSRVWIHPRSHISRPRWSISLLPRLGELY